MQLSLDMPDEINARRKDLLYRLFNRLKGGLAACIDVEFWEGVADVEAWASEALLMKRKIDAATTLDELNQLAYEFALTDEFMLPEELE